MRWKKDKPLSKEDLGKTRFVNKFLWFPKCVNYEVRWLEKAMIEQEVDFRVYYDKDYPKYYSIVYFWQDSKWVDPPINLR